MQKHETKKLELVIGNEYQSVNNQTTLKCVSVGQHVAKFNVVEYGKVANEGTFVATGKPRPAVRLMSVSKAAQLLVLPVPTPSHLIPDLLA